MNIRQRFSDWLARPPVWLMALVVFVIAIFFSAMIQYRPTFNDPDCFYHLRITEMMLEQGGPVRLFSSLPFTILGDNYIDHHFFYHVLLMPFVAFMEPHEGWLVGSIVMSAAVIAAFYVLLRRYQVRYPLIFSLLLATSGHFAFRLNLSKAVSASVLMLILGVWAAKSGKRVWLAALAGVFVWMYDGWPLLPLVLLFGILARVLVELAEGDGDRVLTSGAVWRGLARLDPASWRRCCAVPEVANFGAALFGSAVGVVVNPYFPQNLVFFWEHIVQIGLFNYKDSIQVGSEWYPLALSRLPKTAPSLYIVLGLTLMALFGAVYSGARTRNLASLRRRLPDMFFSTLVTSFFVVMALRNQRHVDYLVPFLGLAVPIIFTMLSEGIDWRATARDFRERVGGFAYGGLKFLGGLLAALIVVFWALVFFFDVKYQVIKKLDGIPWTTGLGAMAALSRVAPPGATVFNSEWDAFPMLFYWNQDFRYMNGMDPTFMYRHDPVKFFIWQSISDGAQERGSALLMKRVFGARFAIIGSRSDKLQDIMNKDPLVRIIFSDPDFTVYRIY